MLSVLAGARAGYIFYYELNDGAHTYGGGMTQAGELVCDAACPQKELMLRTLVFRCQNEGVQNVCTRDVWGLPLARFGFVRAGELFEADAQSLRLPHGCEEDA